MNNRVWLTTIAFVTLLAGCEALPPARVPTEPALRLLSLDAMRVPEGCAIESGRVFRTNFRVDVDGHTRDVTPDSQAPACLREAMSRWVASFRYQPPQDTTPAVIDWMPVIARRGG